MLHRRCVLGHRLRARRCSSRRRSRVGRRSRAGSSRVRAAASPAPAPHPHRRGHRRCRIRRSFRSTASPVTTTARRPAACRSTDVDPAEAPAHAEIWEKVAVKLRGGMMPPQGMPRPDAATLDAFVTALEKTLDRPARCASPDPGHKPVHRLNRTEYGNAVRDLLDLDIDVTEPAAGRRREPRVRQHRRRAARVAVAARAVPRRPRARSAAWRSAPTPTSSGSAYRVPPDDSQDDHVEGLPLGTRGGLLFQHNFPQDAEYEFSVILLRNIVGYMTGLEFAHQLEITDRRRARVHRAGRRRGGQPARPTRTCRRRPTRSTSG